MARLESVGLTPVADAERDRLAIATGFLALGVKDVNQRFQTRFDMYNIDDQIDVVTRAVLALTVTCARCHDHKFDPIPTTDYYALAGIFTSSVNAAGVRNQMGGSGMTYYVPNRLISLHKELPDPPAEIVEQLTQKVAAAKTKWDEIRGTPEGSTQSGSFLNSFDPEDIVVVERDGEATTFKRPDADKLEAWLEDYTLGEVWEKNVIGGGPH